jgi:sortase A
MTTGSESREKPTRIRRALIFAECLAWLVAAASLAAWAVLYVAGGAGQHRHWDRYALRAEQRLRTAEPDQTLWSPARRRGWQEALLNKGPAPIAVLRIARIGIEVPIVEGTDEWTLNRAAGHIAGTADPGTEGNCGIAGHRDGFFRGLKDIVVGDTIELETLRDTEIYRVERTWIVDPDTVSVLDPTPSCSLTLVTCYPFYFVGSAPQRFIVRAVRAATAHTDGSR